MKKAFLVCGALSFLLLWGCLKNDVSPGSLSGSLLDSSKAFFESAVLSSTKFTIKKDATLRQFSDPSKWLNKSPLWEKAHVVSILGKRAIMVPLKYEKPYLIKNSLSGKRIYSADDVNKLLIYRDAKNTFKAEKLTFYPDSNYYNLPGQKFTGIIVVENWNGEWLNTFKYEKGGKIRKYDAKRNHSEPKTINTVSSSSTKIQLIEVCYEASGYNYLADDPDNGYYWTQQLGCEDYFIDDGGGGGGGNSGDGAAGGDDYGNTGGGGGGSGVSPTNPVTVVNGNNPITNVKDYIKCFTNTPGGDNSYSITLCVTQAATGSREPWEFSGSGTSASGDPVSVGHTFLIFNQTNSLGSTIRNIGFYPKNGATPYSPQSQGQLNNDANHDYDIALTINMTSNEFTQVLNFVQQGNDANYLYDLNTNNCTTFALNALGAAGFNLPRTTGSWLNGSGLNPGDLGEDIRQMQLPPDMKRTDLTGRHPNVGFCY